MPLRIRNWSRYQHYRRRNPPWIKLHYDLLQSRDWMILDDASRVLAVSLLLIASRNDGRVPDDADYVRRLASLNAPPDYDPLIACGFLERVEDDDFDRIYSAFRRRISDDGGSVPEDGTPEERMDREMLHALYRIDPSSLRRCLRALYGSDASERAISIRSGLTVRGFCASFEQIREDAVHGRD